MLQVIKFCACSKVNKEEVEEDLQCMIFSFTPRALKILSGDFLNMVTGEKGDEIGIEVNRADEKKIVHIQKIDTNLYKIPTEYIDPFITCLFKFLPGHFISNDERAKFNCDQA